MLNTRQNNFENDFSHFFFKFCHFGRKLQHAFDKRGQFSGIFETNEWKHGPKRSISKNCARTIFAHVCVSAKAWRCFDKPKLSMIWDLSRCSQSQFFKVDFLSLFLKWEPRLKSQIIDIFGVPKRLHAFAKTQMWAIIRLVSYGSHQKLG